MAIFLKVILSVSLIILIGSLFFFNDHAPSSSKQKGVCWVGGRDVVTEKEIAALVNCNVNWISQTPFGWQREANSSFIRTNFSSDRVWWGESDEGISKTTGLAKKSGIKTLLKPHLWVSKGWLEHHAYQSVRYDFNKKDRHCKCDHTGFPHQVASKNADRESDPNKVLIKQKTYP